MTIHIINPYKDIDPQIEEVIATAASSDEVEITEEIDFQSALSLIHISEPTRLL